MYLKVRVEVMALAFDETQVPAFLEGAHEAPHGKVVQEHFEKIFLFDRDDETVSVLRGQRCCAQFQPFHVLLEGQLEWGLHLAVPHQNFAQVMFFALGAAFWWTHSDGVVWVRFARVAERTDLIGNHFNVVPSIVGNGLGVGTAKTQDKQQEPDILRKETHRPALRAGRKEGKSCKESGWTINKGVLVRTAGGGKGGGWGGKTGGVSVHQGLYRRGVCAATPAAVVCTHTTMVPWYITSDVCPGLMFSSVGSKWFPLLTLQGESVVGKRRQGFCDRELKGRRVPLEVHHSPSFFEPRLRLFAIHSMTGIHQ
jgi:hypothetical protein